MNIIDYKTTENIPHVIFFEKEHLYFNRGQKMTSMNGLLDHYFPKFNSEYWLTYKAYKAIDENKFKKIIKDNFPKLKNGEKQYYKNGNCICQLEPDPNKFFPMLEKVFDREEMIKHRKRIKNEWEYKRVLAGVNGTKFHLDRENEEYERGYSINPFSGQKYKVKSQQYTNTPWQNQSICKNLWDLEDGFYAELLVFCTDYNGKNPLLCGQADKVFIQTIGKNRYIDIDDHKTNEKKPTKSDPKKCNGFLSSHYASKHFRYELQMNGYAWMLAQHGFKVRNLGYTWYKNYDPEKSELIKCKNYQHYSERMVKEHLTKL